MPAALHATDHVKHTSLAFKNAKPFIKWAGGKQQLLKQLEPFFPKHFDNYFEPFLGGGAVFFHLHNTERLVTKVFLADGNAELINTYVVIRDHLDELISLLEVHERQHTKDYYYKIRSLDRKEDHNLSKIEQASRFLYLNRTCYNGLYRVNSMGQFNVPMGSYKNPKILHKKRLKNASKALQGVLLEVQDFRSVVDRVEAGDFLYFDPPYVPVSKTASFTGYTAGNFNEDDQQVLAQLFETLTAKGCLCMLSNSFTPLILELYQGYRIETVSANRAINSKANGRGSIQEVVVLNY